MGINLIDTKRAATITNFDWDGGTTGDGALRIENAVHAEQRDAERHEHDHRRHGVPASASPSINGAATHTVTGTTITNTGGDSIIANGGTGNMNFTGRIDADGQQRLGPERGRTATTAT